MTVLENPMVFIGLTLGLFGFAATMTGLALASNWRPWWQVIFYGLLLGVADRFLVYALFDGELLSIPGYFTDTVVLVMVSALAFRLAQVRQMVSQYPWRYRRRGWFFWTDQVL